MTFEILPQIGTMAPNKLFDEKIFLQRYSSTRTGRKTKDYGENLEYPYNAAVKYRKEKYKEDTEKKMYEPIQKYPAEQPSAGSDKQIHQKC
jgi:hypothetical protein